MKRKLFIITIIFNIVLLNVIQAFLPIARVEAIENTEEPDYIEFSIRKTETKNVPQQDGLDLYKVGDIISLDVYLETPNANLYECFFKVQCPKYNTSVVDIKINPELSQAIKDNIKVSTDSYRNAGVFDFQVQADSGIRLNSSSPLKLATVTWEVVKGSADSKTINAEFFNLTYERDGKFLYYTYNPYVFYATAIPKIMFPQPPFSITVGDELIPEVIITPLDSSQAVKIISSDENIIKVLEDGTIRGIKPGDVNIEIISVANPELRETVTMTVTERSDSISPNSINITNKKTEINLYDTYTLQTNINPTNVSDGTISFHSSNPKVIQIDKNGTIEAKEIGEATITVYTCNNKTDSFKLKVTNPVTSIKITNPIIYLPQEGLYPVKTEVESSITNPNIQFSSSNHDVATINPDGWLEALNPGSTVIKAYYGDIEASFVLVVLSKEEFIYVDKIEIVDKKNVMKIGSEYTIQTQITPSNAHNKKVLFSSSNPDIATIDSNGKITALKKGKTTITAAVEYRETSFELAVNETGNEIPIEHIEFYNIKRAYSSRYYTDVDVNIEPWNTTENTTITFSSSNTDVATINSSGLIKPISSGKTVITAKVGNHEISQEVIIFIETEESLVLSNTEITMGLNETRTLGATLNIPEFGSDLELEWESSRPYIAEVDQNGKITAKEIGTTEIKVRPKDCYQPEKICTVTITEKPAYTLGDVNADGTIDSKDATMVLKYATDKIELTETQKLAANVNRDGAIDSKDATLILKYATDKITKFE